MRYSIVWLLLLLFSHPVAKANEYRAFWVDAFNPGFYDSNQVSRLVADVLASHCNVIIPEVRKRGDLFYKSQLEPMAREVAEGFDPLADLLAKARDPRSGRKLEVHAWLVAYPVWRGIDGFPTRTNHPYSMHRDWLDQTISGKMYDGKDYAFDPGHPKVQNHLFDLAMELINNYDIDGLNLDYIHYPGKQWGYNPVSVARFNRLYGRKGTPASSDPDWCQFRRDQVTALVRRIYLSAIALKPELKFSVASITWPPVSQGRSDWVSRSAAYNNIFMDWRGWMEEGIVDINIPLIYGPADERYSPMFNGWCEFAKAHGYGRHVIISPALYLNRVSGSLQQIHTARKLGGNQIHGVALYSYANFSNNKAAREELTAALTRGIRSSSLAAAFARPVATPEMPWKTRPTTGYIKGFVRDGSHASIDGAKVFLTGPRTVVMKSDANGFYGTANLPPGSYRIRVEGEGRTSAEREVQIIKGKVSTVDLRL